jgi:hypothetical protein
MPFMVIERSWHSDMAPATRAPIEKQHDQGTAS